MSTLNVDALVGVSSANAITVRGEGTATTSLQQGLAKAWLQYNQVTPTITGSNNISTVTDTSAGNSTTSFSNAMSALDYAVASAGGMLNTNASGRIAEVNPTNTSSYQVTTANSAGALADHTGTSTATFGDLA
tara:strand:+ start:349 stop:747 length:399 start_codon:yes stop_codon:yes gene_type:complete